MKGVTLHLGDALSVLKTLPSGIAHTCVTSPPYYGLRDYKVDGQIGLEETPGEFIAKLVEVFREVRRVLRDDGTCWVNMGDSYAGSWGAQSRGSTSSEASSRLQGASMLSARQILSHPLGTTGTGSLKNTPGLKNKDLMGIPWRVALALQADGWYLRSDVIWSKPNSMPESVTDRPSKSHEYLFLLAKSERYFYDAEAIKEPSGGWKESRFEDGKNAAVHPNTGKARRSGNKVRKPASARGVPVNTDGSTNGAVAGSVPWEGSTRNKRTVWTIPVSSYAEAHFATFPEALARPCILAGTSEKGCCPKCGAPWWRVTESTESFESGSGKSGNRPIGKQDLSASDTNSTPDIRMGPVISTRAVGWHPGCACGESPVPCTVLEPFAGSGTTLAVAIKHGRHAIGIELNPDYKPLIMKRLKEARKDRDAFECVGTLFCPVREPTLFATAE